MHGHNLKSLFFVLLSALLLSACAGGNSGFSEDGAQSRAAVGKVNECKPGDKRVASQAQCLQDDAACYPLTDGSWCTGPRGLTCPAGSRALKKGEPCPPGSKCFSPGPNLECVIDL